ncbi:hypothetical protein [Neisseria subflava]|uniref:hypothetical protein n=1 Tax=Neisseria subflava TaxID=28449 RepID=UPI00202AAF3C|nr:hypothetical protein [Neisseria subflava]
MDLSCFFLLRLFGLDGLIGFKRIMGFLCQRLCVKGFGRLGVLSKCDYFFFQPAVMGGDGIVVFRQLGRNAYIVTVYDAVAVGEPVWNDGVLVADQSVERARGVAALGVSKAVEWVSSFSPRDGRRRKVAAAFGFGRAQLK